MHAERCTVTLIKSIYLTTTSEMLITISVKYCQKNRLITKLYNVNMKHNTISKVNNANQLAILMKIT
jgi:hypothetical protein